MWPAARSRGARNRPSHPDEPVSRTRITNPLLRWDGKPGHYEVYYLSATDPASGIGLWIRYTMVAPLPDTGREATCSLWLMAMAMTVPR